MGGGGVVLCVHFGPVSLAFTWSISQLALFQEWLLRGVPLYIYQQFLVYFLTKRPLIIWRLKVFALSITALPSLRMHRLPLHMTPEIQRTPLHEIALSIKLLKLGHVSSFLQRAIEAPPSGSVTEALVLLRELEALDVNDELTPLGTILARLPIEPRLGRMIVLGTIFGYVMISLYLLCKLHFV